MPQTDRTPASAQPAVPLVSKRSECLRWPLLAAVLPLLPGVIIFFSCFAPRQRQFIWLDAIDRPQLSQPFLLQRGVLGSPLIDLQAKLPANSSMGLSVELLDQNGDLVLELEKEGWREIGTWVEDGESGTYDESDSSLKLDLRPISDGPHRLRLTLEEFSDAAAQPLQPPLQLQLLVNNHSVDLPLLLITAGLSLLLVLFFWQSIYGDCRQRSQRRLVDDRVSSRFSACGPGLLRIKVLGRYELPDRLLGRKPEWVSSVSLVLRITNAWGELLLEDQLPLQLNKKSDEDDTWWTVNSGPIHLFLGKISNLRFWAALPDPLANGCELEWIELLVEDGATTPWPVRLRVLC
ncbi:MAG: hypothetical protein AB8B70_09635 [Prochlorococcus sp.]